MNDISLLDDPPATCEDVKPALGIPVSDNESKFRCALCDLLKESVWGTRKLRSEHATTIQYHLEFEELNHPVPLAVSGLFASLNCDVNLWCSFAGDQLPRRSCAKLACEAH